MSAWEYAAPTTRLDSRVVFLGPFAGVGLRQNGEADLLAGQRRVANACRDQVLLGSVYGGARARLSISVVSGWESGRAREDIPTWTISCYTQHTTSQSRSRVASLSHRGQRGERDVPVAAASCHSQRRRRTFWVQATADKRKRIKRCATRFNSWLLLVRSLDRASSQSSRLPRDTHIRPQRCDCSNARLLKLGFAVGCQEPTC